MDPTLNQGSIDNTRVDQEDFILASAAATMLLKAGTTFLQRTALFEGLSASDCSLVAELADQRQYRKGEPIFQQGDRAQSVLMVVFGNVKIAQFSRNGKEVILRMDGPGDVLTLPGTHRGMLHSSSAHGLETTNVLTWHIDDFEQMQHRIPSIRKNAQGILTQRLTRLETAFLELATETVAQRLAHTLLRLSRAGNVTHPAIHLTNEQLAAMIGATLFTVNRLLSEWVTCGIVERHRRSIRILNASAMEQVANEEL